MSDYSEKLMQDHLVHLRNLDRNREARGMDSETAALIFGGTERIRSENLEGYDHPAELAKSLELAIAALHEEISRQKAVKEKKE